MKITNETWKPVVEYEQKYQVSDLGRVRSIDHWDGRRRVTGRVLRPGRVSGGHLSVALGKGNSVGVHTLVMLAFRGERPTGQEVLHLNHIPHDNRLDNLKYGTRSENLKMDYAVGVRRLPRYVGEAHPKAKFTDACIRVIRTSTLSMAELGRIFGVAYQTIDAIQSKRTWKHVI